MVEQTSSRLIILDLAELSCIDSAGLGLVALAHREFDLKGINLCIANAQGSVNDIMPLTNLDKMDPLDDSVAAISQR